MNPNDLTRIYFTRMIEPDGSTSTNLWIDNVIRHTASVNLQNFDAKEKFLKSCVKAIFHYLHNERPKPEWIDANVDVLLPILDATSGVKEAR